MNEVEIPLKITGIGAMKAELRELKGAIADATDPAQMAALAARAGELKDKIGDANEAVNVFASGSKFEQVSNSLGGIKDSLMSLDFEEANEKAKVFAGALGKLNPADLAKGMKGLMGTISTVGGAFVKLGMTILANPLFLLIAVITAIVVAIGFFLKKIGVLDAIFKAIMGPINAVIQGFKDLTDWMGLTDNAAEENAEAVKEASEKNIKNIQEQGKAREDLYNLTKDMSNAEIEALEKQLGIEINQNESIYDIKQQTMEQTYAQNQAEMDALSLKKELTEEDKKRMDELFAKQVQLNRDMIANEIARIQAKQKLELDLDKQIEMLQAKQIKGESERAKAMLEIQKKEALSKVEQQIKEAQQTGDTALLAKALKLKGLIIDDFKRQELEITNKGNAGIAKANVTSVSNTNKEVKNKYSDALTDLRKKNEIAYREAETAGKNEQELRDLKVTQLEAEKAYITKNLSQIYKKEIDQKDALSKIDNEIKKAKDKTIAEQEKADNERLLNKLERNVVNAKSDIDLFNAEKALLIEQSRQKMLTLEVDSEAALLLEDETAKGIEAINKKIIDSEDEKNLKILAAAQLVAETKLSKEAFALERFKGTKEQEIAINEAFLQTTLATLDTQRIAELEVKNLSKAEIAAINEKYDQAEIVAAETKAAKLVEIDDKAREKLNANINAGFQLATQAMSSIGSLQDINTKKKLKGVEKGSKEEEVILKRQFEQQKKMQLAMAVINGAQAIASIFAQYPKFDGGFAMAAALAGSVIATTTSLATIASTTFEGGGTAPDAPDTNSLTGGGTGGMATPNVSLFGSNNNLNNVGAPQDGQQGQNITVTAIVSETEMTSTQDRVNRIKRNAEL
jgi:hypothetical protein